MRVAVRASLVLAAVTSLAACGSIAVPMASRLHLQHSGTQIVVARRGPPAGSRAEAIALARLMLSRLRLPAGARRLPPVPVPRPVSEPDLWAGAAAALDVHQLFELRQSAAAVAAAVTAHAPAGMSLASTGGLVSSAGVRSREVGYTARQIPTGIYAAQLVLTVAPAGPARSLVRADAQVIWFPPRTAAEYIDPEGYHVLAITVTIAARQHAVGKVVTSQAVITRLADALDRSPVQPVQVPNCPDIFAYYRLAFAVSRRDRPGVVVLATRWPCGGAQIRVGGRRQPPLEDEGTVVAMADRLLGVTPGP
jgi:hypothetical protein